MQKNRYSRLLSMLALGASLLMPVVYAQTGAGMGMSGMKGDTNKPMPMPMPMKGSGMDMKSMMMDMESKMSAMKSSGNTDVDFAMMMRMHHQSAITMAEAELQNGKDPQMRVLAKDIIYAQKKEIAVFDRFLAKRGEPGMKMGEPAMKMTK